MKHEELYKILLSLNIPVAYDHFDDNKTLEPPFMAYREKVPDTVNADNINFYSFNKFEIELVTSKKDVALENKVSSLLTKNSISFEKSEEIWDSQEKIYHIFFDI